MKEERLAVLRLLENGVINAEEAERLLLTLRPVPPAPNYYEKVSSAGENMANLARKAGKKVGKATEAAAKKAEPVIKRAAEKIGEKTEEVCTNAKNYVDKKKAEREKAYVPDIDEQDVSDVTDAPEAETAAEAPVNEASNTDGAENGYVETETDNSAENGDVTEEAAEDTAFEEEESDK
ncbi:MAG: hypothetical protein IJS35_02600 [Firmicutes bacterium]|nr:hypothetical protein [Bacillota bacterium]MBR0104630.1 hypothetical protein [Bacillota bacterium]